MISGFKIIKIETLADMVLGMKNSRRKGFSSNIRTTMSLYSQSWITSSPPQLSLWRPRLQLSMNNVESWRLREKH
jgi:hypothetical protein